MNGDWRYLDVNYSDTNVNIAFEEALIRAIHRSNGQNLIRLWTNSPVVVIGRNQDLLVEVDVNFCQVNDIDIARRASGGGAVFIGPGTILTSYVVNHRSMKSLNTNRYSYFQDIIISLLDKIGVQATLDSRGAVKTPEGKISGTAQHQLGNYLLHHNTLLVSENLDHLELSLSGQEPPATFRKVRSHKMPVTSLEKILDRSIKMREVTKLLLETVKETFKITLTKSDPNPLEEKLLKQLYQNKYTSNRWLTEGKY
ncbi:MAG: lipoate--protein ligase family protein [Candidatus Hodarchaeales archaeon]